MKMPKPTEEDKERFRSLVPDDPRVEVKPMFGNLGAFVNGNMFMGLFGSDIGLKLDDAGCQTLTAQGGGPFGPEERPMGGYVTIPAGWTTAQAEAWAATSLALVGALPPKQKRQKRQKKS